VAGFRGDASPLSCSSGPYKEREIEWIMEMLGMHEGGEGGGHGPPRLSRHSQHCRLS
jgi:hypothetical protein